MSELIKGIKIDQEIVKTAAETRDRVIDDYTKFTQELALEFFGENPTEEQMQNPPEELINKLYEKENELNKKIISARKSIAKSINLSSGDKIINGNKKPAIALSVDESGIKYYDIDNDNISIYDFSKEDCINALKNVIIVPANYNKEYISKAEDFMDRTFFQKKLRKGDKVVISSTDIVGVFQEYLYSGEDDSNCNALVDINGEMQEFHIDEVETL